MGYSDSEKRFRYIVVQHNTALNFFELTFATLQRHFVPATSSTATTHSTAKVAAAPTNS